MELEQLIEASRMFLEFLDKDPWILEQSRLNPASWEALKKRLVEMGWGGFVLKWATVHRSKVPYGTWVKAGFALPYRAEYYRAVCRGLMEDAKFQLLSHVKSMIGGSSR